MTNTQLYLATGLPTLSSFLTLILVLIAWLSNRSDNAALRAEMIALRRDVSAEFIAFRRDIAAEFTAFRREIYTELVQLHERVVKVETKQDIS